MTPWHQLRRLGIAIAIIAGVVLAFCLVGCGDLGAPDCTSTCGMRLYATGRGVPKAQSADCVGFDRAERLALSAFERNVSDWSIANTCPELRGWRVYTYDGELDQYGAWYDEYDRHIAGQTWCALGFMDVNNQRWFDGSSLIHEMAHAIERCADWDHTSWGPRGIYDAITTARSNGQLEQQPVTQ